MSVFYYHYNYFMTFFEFEIIFISIENRNAFVNKEEYKKNTKWVDRNYNIQKKPNPKLF